MSRSTIVVGTVVLGLVVLFVLVLWPSGPDATVPAVAATKADVPLRRPKLEPAAAPSPDPMALPAPPSPLRLQAEDRDLFATDRALKASNAGSDLVVARSILLECYSWMGPRSLLRTVAAGRAPTHDSAAPEPVQVDAAIDVLARCRGFDGMTRLEQQQAWADTGSRLDRADDAAGWAEAVQHGRRHIGDDLLRAIVASQDMVAIADIGEELDTRFRKAHGLPVDGGTETRTQRLNEQYVVATLVTCDLVDACGPTSFAARVACAFHAEQCGADLRAIALADAGVADEDRRKVFARVDTIVAGIRARDLSIRGL